ncbi:agmatinase family protein [Edaphosphingomonas haloaromaticamans]|uniref:Proclavaminate amidinohydrolase n=1 Tax=Edaphosphingomonas haloaromaticamans TaxID=653954 RepID=A0A1S1HKT2_9SPHN|nr:agmatinase family protein [Sphingomonas haloaromaticamans]OHT21843.1 Proclavaminate amidinohydrolase [Sphingomonas haloaromaticamans]
MGLSRKLGIIALSAAAGIASLAIAQSTEKRFAPEIEAKLDKLTPEQAKFLRSKETDRFVSVEGELERRLAAKSPEEIQAYVAAMMEVIEASKFNPKTDLASIPLNPEAKSFNSWKVLRPAELDPKREPGPFSLSRYVEGRSGIPTFFGLPVALRPDDLTAGKVDIAMVGIPLNMGSGTRGAHLGPTAMRTVRMGAGNDMYTMTSPRAVLNMVDYGDVAVDNMSTERSMGHVREQVASIAKTGAIPFIVGGDHSLAYSDIAGVTDVLGKGKVSVIHFDSHYDAGRGRAHLIDHGQPVYRLIKEGHVAGRDYIQVGLRAQSPDIETFEWMREQGFRYHTMVEVEKSGWDVVVSRVLKEAKENGKRVFVSFDIDVLDPAYMVGTGTPVPDGLTMREVVPLIRRICAETDLAGFELVELDPTMDPTYRSAQNSAYIMHACMAGMAIRKKGITQEHYLSPLSSEWQKPAEKKGRQKPTT